MSPFFSYAWSIDDSSSSLSFDQDKKNENHYDSLEEHVKLGKFLRKRGKMGGNIAVKILQILFIFELHSEVLTALSAQKWYAVVMDFVFLAWIKN